VVNKGTNYTAAQAGMQLERGNRILTPADGSAQLVYKNGCVLRLGPNRSLTVKNQEQCKAALLTPSNAGAQAAQGGGPVTAAAGSGLPALAGLPWPAWVAAAGVGGLITAGAITNGGGGSGSNNQISPE